MKRTRSVASMVCLVLGLLLLPAAVAGRWARDTVVDEKGYLAAVAPLATDPAVMKAVEDRLTAQVMTAVESRQLLGGVLNGPIEALVGRAATFVVESPQFATAWTAANQAAHRQLVSVLSGDTGNLSVGADNTVDLTVDQLGAALRDGLTAAGVPFAAQIPDVSVTFPIGTTQQVARGQQAYTALDRWGAVLPFVVAVLLLVAVLVADRRLRALAWTGLGGVLGMLALEAAMVLGRSRLLDALPSGSPPAAARAWYDALTTGLRQTLLVVMLVAAVLMAVGFVADRAVRRGDRARAPTLAT